MRSRKFLWSLLLGTVAVAPLLLGNSVAEESKLKCETVKGYKCDARPDGTLYNCRNITTEKCTVVSGPGSGKKLSANPGGTITTKPPAKPIAPAGTATRK
jgi:hypothetical protein